MLHRTVDSLVPPTPLVHVCLWCNEKEHRSRNHLTLLWLFFFLNILFSYLLIKAHRLEMELWYHALHGLWWSWFPAQLFCCMAVPCSRGTIRQTARHEEGRWGMLAGVFRKRGLWLSWRRPSGDWLTLKPCQQRSRLQKQGTGRREADEEGCVTIEDPYRIHGRLWFCQEKPGHW